jgi:hypothetical protein
MMISTGLPELSSEKDLNYLRETLVSKLYKKKVCRKIYSFSLPSVADFVFLLSIYKK